MYYSSYTASLVGFGDIHPVSTLSRVVVFCQCLIAIFMYYVVFRGGTFNTSLGKLQKRIDKEEKMLNETLSIMIDDETTTTEAVSEVPLLQAKEKYLRLSVGRE